MLSGVVGVKCYRCLRCSCLWRTRVIGGVEVAVTVPGEAKTLELRLVCILLFFTLYKVGSEHI